MRQISRFGLGLLVFIALSISATGPALALPDLISTKSNDTGGTATLGDTFTWTLEVENIGDQTATVPSSNPFFLDTLPSTNISYGAVTITPISGIGGTFSCSISAAAVLLCLPIGEVTIAAGGSVTFSVTATPATAGTFTNPVSPGNCTVDLTNVVTEASEVNNACNSDSVAVSSGSVGPDLIAFKSNNVGGATELASGDFLWSIAISNGGTTAATFSNGTTILTDDLPNSGISYGTPTLSAVAGITGEANISCSISAFTLTCSASGGDVTLAAGSGTFTVDLITSPSTAATFANPRSGMVCKADPDGLFAEDDEANNDCSDSVVVSDSPDLIATKTNNTGGAGTVGVPFTWSIQIDNIGGADFFLSTSFPPLLTDSLPDTNMTYGAVQVTSSGLTGQLNCAITGSNLLCQPLINLTLIPGGQVTVSFAATPTAVGTFANPRPEGACAADITNGDSETDESNNFCSDSVAVTSGVSGPDLSVAKNNDVSSATELASGPFTWSLQAANGGDMDATFGAGEVILTDNLPNSGISYGLPSITNVVDVTGGSNIVCSVATSNLSCIAQGGSVTLAAGTGSFTVDLVATPSVAGTYANPRVGGSCTIDPNNEITEGDEANNTCADSIVVNDSPDLTATKTNDTGGIADLDTPFIWSIQVANIGGATFSSDSGLPVFLDSLPDTDIAYGTPTLSNSSGVTGTLSCSIDGSTNLICTPTQPFSIDAGGGFTINVTATPSATGTFANPRGAGICRVDYLSRDLELDETNNDCADSVTVPPLAALSLTKSDSPDPVVAGAPLTFTLTAANAGPDTAAEVTVYDLLPEGTSFDAVASDVGCSQPAGLVGLTGNLVDISSLQGGGGPGGSGLTGLVLDTTTNELRFAIAVQGVAHTVTGASLRLAGGTLVHTLYQGAPPTFDDSSPISGTIQLNQSEADALQIADSHVVRVDTDTNPGGELQGGIAVTISAPVTCDLGTIAASADSSAAIVVNVGVDQGGNLLDNIALVDSPGDDPNEAALPSGSLRGGAATSMTNVGSETDFTIAKSDSVDPVTAGETLTYSLLVTNNGPSNSTGATVTDPLPAGTAFAASADDCQEMGGTVTCSIGTLTAGASEAVSFTVTVGAAVTASLSNTATVTANGDDPTAGNNSDEEPTAVVASADLALGKSAAPDPAVAGSQLTYSLTVTNNGPSNSTGSTIADLLPAGTSFVSSPDGCSESSGTVSCAVAALAVGEEQTVQFVVLVAPSTIGPIANSATVTGNENDAVSGNNTATSNTSVGQSADLEINQTDSVDPATAGTGLSYSLVVTNQGPSDDPATITVTDSLPTGVTFVSGTGTGWSCGETAGPSTGTGIGAGIGSGIGTVTCTRTGLAVGAAPPITIAVTIDSSTTSSLTNTVSVTSATTDPDPGSDDTNVTEATAIVTEADLSIIKTDSVDPVPGNSFSYSLEVSNAGPSDARNVTATDTLPTGLLFDSSPDDCAEDSGIVTCDFGTLAAGNGSTFTFTVTLDSPPSPSVLNTAVVSSDEPDSVSANNMDDEETGLDADLPTITLVNSVADTGDGELSACETSIVEIQQLLVTFSEPMNDPIGDDDTNDVSNPNNYQLIAAGLDRSIETTLCSGVQGDDQVIALASVAYDSPSRTTTLSTAVPIASDLYQLLVCDEVQDIAGNPLDGDGSGSGGEDFARLFRVDAENLLGNGHFDCDLSSWTLQSTDPQEIAWNSDDHQASTSSGSAALTNLSSSLDFQLSQCGNFAQPGQPHLLSARFRLSAPGSAMLGLSRGCSFFDGANCTGTELDSATEVAAAADTAGSWEMLSLPMVPPNQALSAACSFLLSAPNGDGFDANLDALSLGLDPNLLFADGFESGDTSAWTLTFPAP